MSSLGSLAHKLYSGEVSYDFVGKRRRWYAISGVILLLALIGLFGRGLNLGIEFKGGSEFTIPNTTASVEQARASVEKAGVVDPIVTQIGTDKLRIQTPALTPTQSAQVTTQLSTDLGVANESIGVQLVGPSWGAEITKRAVQGLIAFLILVAIFLSAYFEWRLAVAALVALLHDLLITIGIYALVGFEVTPATVIGVLTILGFSLYDTVVVFDKVRENTRGITSGNRATYSEAANLALNQTLIRSINTSVVALLPVGAILVIGVGFLGAGTLKDLALALFIGTAAGTYSSIFIATPVACQLEERRPEMKALAARVAARRAGGESKAKSTRKAAAGAGPLRTGRGSERSARAAEVEQAPQQAQEVVGAELERLLDHRIRSVVDWPVLGVTFRDITPLLADPRGIPVVVEGLVAALAAQGIVGVDLVAGVEARGFVLGAPLAVALGAGFVPVRKEGKLPGDVHAETYDLEYGTATLELQVGAIAAGHAVLLVDDVLATGGTAAAAALLLRAAGADVVALAVLLELPALRGRERLGDLPVLSLRAVRAP